MTTQQFDKYIEQTRGQMLRFATAILRSEYEAQDVVSGVIERLWCDRERLDEKKALSTYVMSAVKNGCYDHIRYKKRWKKSEVDENIYKNDQDIEKLDKIELVRYALTLLSDRHREIIHLKDIEGYKTEEIALIFDIKQANVRMILSRARVALRDIIIKLDSF